MKYKDWLNEWLTVYVRPVAKRRTLERYERICRRQIVPALGEYDLEELSALLLQRFITGLSPQYAPNTVSGALSVIKNSLKQAVAAEFLPKQITSALIRPRLEEKPIECFSADEQRKIENYIAGSNRPKLVGVLLSLYTGLRIGELLALEWKDIDFSKGLIYVSKSCHDSWGEDGYRKIIEKPKTKNSERLIPVPAALTKILKKAKREIGGTYVIGGDSTVSVRSYQRTFELLLNKLKISRRGFHSLRHTFATRAVECGMDAKTLSEILGHKNANITLNRYVHSLMDHKRSMMNRLGKLLQ